MRSENTKTRLDRMLNADKEEMNEATKTAVIAEFTRVAKEYFETDGELAFQMRKNKGRLEITIAFRASRVKNFTVLK